MGVGNNRVGTDRSRAFIDRVVDEFHSAPPAVVRLVGELDLDRVWRIAGRAPLAGLLEADIFKVEALGAVEAKPDRIRRDDAREQRLARGHIVAERDALVRDLACNRRAHDGELEIE